jgi:UDPglucose 6-dehydrogenase
MHIGVMGAGYVGLVTGVCLAETGHAVRIVDIDPDKIATLRRGESPHYEPGLGELLRRNLDEGRLAFSTDAADAVAGREAVFLAVGTPGDEDGRANLSFLEAAAEAAARAAAGPLLFIVKSTVPVGANRCLEALIRRATKHPFELASNPEFLKEGAAIDDFMRPDRVVIGVRAPAAEATLRRIYEPFVRTGSPILVVDPETAEMIKYAANALLASRISFMNEMSAICRAVGADIDGVRKGVGADRRLGSAFLFAGLGYGGSCFPKDVRALAASAESLGLPADLCRAIDAVNARQRDFLLPYLEGEFGADWRGRTFALWGLAFKPRTDDVREAPALHLARTMVARGAAVRAYDPEATETARRELADMAKQVTFCRTPQEAADGADALAICTEWGVFRSPDFADLKRRIRRAVIFDGRNLYDPREPAAAGFVYYSVGRPPTKPSGG